MIVGAVGDGDPREARAALFVAGRILYSVNIAGRTGELFATPPSRN